MYGVLHYKNKTITENEITENLGNDGIWATIGAILIGGLVILT